MITVSVKNLVEAIREADAFALPEMNNGTAYLYDAVYRRMLSGQDARLSDVDFDAFEQEDVESLHDLHSDVFERNNYTSHSLSCALRSMVPVCKAVGYV